MEREGWVYMLASKRNGTLYLGVTSDVATQLEQHRSGAVTGFAKKYGCRNLVWLERHDDILEARQRELRMKKWKRAWKLDLIERDNPQWQDLSDRIEH